MIANDSVQFNHLHWIPTLPQKTPVAQLEYLSTTRDFGGGAAGLHLACDRPEVMCRMLPPSLPIPYSRRNVQPLPAVPVLSGSVLDQ